MSLLSTFSPRQQALLKLMLLHREGLTVDALANELTISRNAVVQHLASLEAGGYVECLGLASNRGRPSKLYTLSQAGLELFPRHYDLLANLLVRLIQSRLGEVELRHWLDELGQQLARDFSHRMEPCDTLSDKIATVAAIMHELGYEARVGDNPQQPEIIASNCVFHNLARDCSEVCNLDLTLISSLVGEPIQHRECMVRGGSCCRFAVQSQTAGIEAK